MASDHLKYDIEEHETMPNDDTCDDVDLWRYGLEMDTSNTKAA